MIPYKAVNHLGFPGEDGYAIFKSHPPYADPDYHVKASNVFGCRGLTPLAGKDVIRIFVVLAKPFERVC